MPAMPPFAAKIRLRPHWPHHDVAGPDRAGHIPRSRMNAFRREAPLLAALTPAALLLAVFFVVPAVWAIGTSLTDRALLGIGATDTRFIGLDNYRRLWNNPDFPKFVRNTVVFVVGSALIGQTGLGLALALLLDHAKTQRARLAPLAYGAVLVAWIVPPAMAGAIWGTIFEYRDGPLNNLLTAVGLPRIDMLSDHQMLAVIVADAWRGTAFAMVIFLGALQTVPSSVYEAARIDGANAWHRLRDHTLPLMSQLMVVVLLTTTIVTSGSFLLNLVMTNGGSAYETETIALFAFHRAFVSYDIGFGSAIAMVMLALNLLFAAVYLRIARIEE